jgi:hypothetical protein
MANPVIANKIIPPIESPTINPIFVYSAGSSLFYQTTTCPLSEHDKIRLRYEIFP